MAGSDDGPETLDPALVRDAESSFYTRQIFRGLVRLDNDMQAQPDLAQRITISLQMTHRRTTPGPWVQARSVPSAARLPQCAQRAT